MAVDDKAPERIGCGDRSCVIAPPRGVGTNVGCRCDARKLRREVQRLQKRYKEAMEALNEIRLMRPREFEFPDDWSEQVRACPNCARYKGHPIQQGICDEHRRPLWDRVQFDAREREALGLRMREIADAIIDRHRP